MQPGGDVIPNFTDFDTTSVGGPTRRRTKPTRMNISSTKGSPYDIALVQAICMTQIAEAVKGKGMSMNRCLKLWVDRE